MEIKSVDPPQDIRAAMEKQMRAERDRRAAILTAEGEKQAQILTAEGQQQAVVLPRRGRPRQARRSCAPRAKRRRSTPSSKRSTTANPRRELLSYEYLQMLPSLAEGDSNKVFVIPSEFAVAFGGIGEAIARRSEQKPSAVAPMFDISR